MSLFLQKIKSAGKFATSKKVINSKLNTFCGESFFDRPKEIVAETAAVCGSFMINVLLSALD